MPANRRYGRGPDVACTPTPTPNDAPPRLRLCHEVSVLRAEALQFEYVNCHPQTGLLRVSASASSTEPGCVLSEAAALNRGHDGDGTSMKAIVASKRSAGPTA